MHVLLPSLSLGHFLGVTQTLSYTFPSLSQSQCWEAYLYQILADFKMFTIWTNKTCTENPHIEFLSISQTFNFLIAVIKGQAVAKLVWYPWTGTIFRWDIIVQSGAMALERDPSAGLSSALHPWEAASGVRLEGILSIAFALFILEPISSKVKHRKSPKALFPDRAPR